MRTDVIFNTDAASGLGRLPDNFIDCIVASPPYWQLRDYGLSPILLGGRQKCEHDFDDYAICRSCGGWLGQLGQEPSREMFLEHLMGIFDECRRVLKSTGTLWVNLGDSYSKLNKYNRTDDWPPGKNAHCLKTLRVDLSMHRVPAYFYTLFTTIYCIHKPLFYAVFLEFTSFVSFLDTYSNSDCHSDHRVVTCTDKDPSFLREPVQMKILRTVHASA